jgi:hypothetical protein
MQQSHAKEVKMSIHLQEVWIKCGLQYQFLSQLTLLMLYIKDIIIYLTIVKSTQLSL